MKEERESLDFLGYTFRYDRDLKGRAKKYLNLFPSEQALQKEREKLHEMTDSHQCFKPIPRAKAKSSAWRTEPATEGMGQLLFDWISDYGLPADRLVRTKPSGAASQTAQPAAF